MHLTLHLTTACSMACRYCYAPPTPGAAMDRDTIEAALALGHRLSGEEHCGIVFFGGEPLLHRDLVAWTLERMREREAAGQGRFHAKITTNGLHLDDEFLDLADRHGMLVAMSCDGVRDAHDAHRRMPDGTGSFDRILPRLRLLLARRPYASVMTTVNPDTVRHLRESIRFLVDLGARYLVVSMNWAADWDDAAFAELERQYTGLADDYLAWTRAGRRFYLSPFEVKIGSHVDRATWRRSRCDLAMHQISVVPDGTLYPCVQFPARGEAWGIGHVRTGLDESARARIRQQAAGIAPACERCAIAERCLRTCSCLNLQATGIINGVPDSLCRHERLLLPIADRVAATLWRERSPIFIHKHYDAAAPVLDVLADAFAAPSRR